MSTSNRTSADLDTAGFRHSAKLSSDRIEEAITNPGAVKINVKGAFIVEDESPTRSPVEGEGIHYERKDIRLPHHTGVVSHVAVDVSLPLFGCSPHIDSSPQSHVSHAKRTEKKDC